MPISVAEAILGARVEVPTLDGPQDDAHPARDELRARSSGSGGRGSRRRRRMPEGDLYIIPKVVVPKSVDDESREAHRGIRRTQPGSTPGKTAGERGGSPMETSHGRSQSGPAKAWPEKFTVSTATLLRWEGRGLVRAVREGDVEGYGPVEIRRLWTILTFQRDLGINLAGIEVILRLRERDADATHARLDQLAHALRDRPWTSRTRG